MKIAVSAVGAGPDAMVDSRFGRAAFFAVYDTETATYEFIDNMTNVDVAHGAGTSSSEALLKKGVEVVVTGHCGPKAAAVFKESNTRVFLTDSCTVAEAIRRMTAGELTETHME